MNLFESIQRYSRYRSIRQELSGLNDRQLKDMGIAPGRIKEFAKKAAVLDRP